MNIIDNSGEDSTDDGMRCDTRKVNVLRTCTVPVDVIVNGQLIELSLIKNGVLKSELSKSELSNILYYM